jgi:hypothetical protein
MNQRPPLRRLILLAALTFTPSLAACGRVPGQFEIINDQVPVAGATGCMVPVNPILYQGVGRLDLELVQSDAQSAYLLFPLLENNLPRPQNSGVDSNQIQMNGFNIDITSLAGTTPETASVLDGSPMAHFRTTWSGAIGSGGAQLNAIVDAFPVALAGQLFNQGNVAPGPTATLNLRVQALGTTTGGTDIQSDPFDFPLEICVGCLIGNVQSCPFTGTPANPGNPCNSAQDDPVDCCTDAAGALICPPAVASK